MEFFFSSTHSDNDLNDDCDRKRWDENDPIIDETKIPFYHCPDNDDVDDDDGDSGWTIEEKIGFITSKNRIELSSKEDLRR